VTACDVVRRPSRGHEAAMEDFMSKGVEGYVVLPDLGMGGGGGDQLMLQAGRWGKVWRGGKVLVGCGEHP
jgi:hypothetical protein